MKKPKIVTAKMVTIVDIPGGGPLEDGSAIVIEFEVLDGTLVPLRFSLATADKLVSAARRFVFEAQSRGHKGPVLSAAGAIEVTTSMMSFQSAQDGSHGRIVIRPTSGPPLSIRIEPEDFPSLRDQLANIERLMQSARKPRGN